MNHTWHSTSHSRTWTPFFLLTLRMSLRSASASSLIEFCYRQPNSWPNHVRHTTQASKTCLHSRSRFETVLSVRLLFRVTKLGVAWGGVPLAILDIVVGLGRRPEWIDSEGCGKTILPSWLRGKNLSLIWHEEQRHASLPAKCGWSRWLCKAAVVIVPDGIRDWGRLWDVVGGSGLSEGTSEPASPEA